MHDTPLVSVVMITYNHEDYIERAINGVLNQETDFAYELIVSNDRSPDKTDEVIRRIVAAHPKGHLVRYFNQEKNLGANRNSLFAQSQAKGKYLALCEGDDEWTDPEKLQKQVALLEAEPGVAMVYANAKINDIKNPASNIYFGNRNRPKPRSNRYEIMEGLVVPTCTVMFRNKLVNYPDWFVHTRASAYFLFHMLSKHGDIAYMDEVVALYNHHYQGMSRTTRNDDMFYADALYNYKLLEYFDNDPRMAQFIYRSNFNSVNELTRMNRPRLAMKLFWKLPLQKIMALPPLRKEVSKLFVKTHLFFIFKPKKRSGMCLLSVLTTSYNRADYIRDSIESVLASSFTDFEHIIVDDGSNDETVEIARSYEKRDSRVKVYVNEKNLGDYNNRNKAASYAKGKYIKFVDSDDYIYPWGLQAMVSSMEKFPEAGFGVSAGGDPKQPYPILLSPREAYLEHFFGYGHFHRSPGSVIMRRDAFEKVGGFSGQRMIGDTEMWFRLGRHFPMVKFPPDLYWARCHEGQESQSDYANRKYELLQKQVLADAFAHKDCPLNEKEKQLILANAKKTKLRETLRKYIPV